MRAACLKHGYSSTRLGKIWVGMIRRCHNPEEPSYARYGGRGITVCDRWRESVASFVEDMGEPPSLKHSLDRIDNDGPYSPENCRWATMREQMRNTSRKVVVTYRGETKLLAEWVDELGLVYTRVHGRIFYLGWPVEQAFEAPSTRPPAFAINSP